MEIIIAKNEGKQIPALLDVGFEEPKAWAHEMMGTANEPLRAGASNTESNELSNQLQSFAHTSSPSEQLCFGNAADCTLGSVTAATVEADLFDSPTTSEVQRDMPKRKRSYVDGNW